MLLINIQQVSSFVTYIPFWPPSPPHPHTFSSLVPFIAVRFYFLIKWSLLRTHTYYLITHIIRKRWQCRNSKIYAEFVDYHFDYPVLVTFTVKYSRKVSWWFLFLSVWEVQSTVTWLLPRWLCSHRTVWMKVVHFRLEWKQTGTKGSQGHNIHNELSPGNLACSPRLCSLNVATTFPNRIPSIRVSMPHSNHKKQ